MGSRDDGSEIQLAPIVVCKVSVITRGLACKGGRATAVLLFRSSKQTGADEQLDHMVTPCHGTFVGVDLRHELAQRRSKGSLSSTEDPILALLGAMLMALCHDLKMTRERSL